MSEVSPSLTNKCQSVCTTTFGGPIPLSLSRDFHNHHHLCLKKFTIETEYDEKANHRPRSNGCSISTVTVVRVYNRTGHRLKGGRKRMHIIAPKMGKIYPTTRDVQQSHASVMSTS